MNLVGCVLNAGRKKSVGEVPTVESLLSSVIEGLRVPGTDGLES